MSRDLHYFIALEWWGLQRSIIVDVLSGVLCSLRSTSSVDRSSTLSGGPGCPYFSPTCCLTSINGCLVEVLILGYCHLEADFCMGGP